MTAHLPQGLSLGLVIHVFGVEVGLGLNPAREVGSRLVVAWSAWSWQVAAHPSHPGQGFLEARAWLWVPVTWSAAGALIGALLHWLLIEVVEAQGSTHPRSLASVRARRPSPPAGRRPRVW